MEAETSPVSFQSTPADPVTKRVETVGKIQPHVTAKVVDSDGNIVPVGTPGEVVVAGYLLQKGRVLEMGLILLVRPIEIDVGTGMIKNRRSRS